MSPLVIVTSQSTSLSLGVQTLRCQYLNTKNRFEYLFCSMPSEICEKYYLAIFSCTTVKGESKRCASELKKQSKNKNSQVDLSQSCNLGRCQSAECYSRATGKNIGLTFSNALAVCLIFMLKFSQYYRKKMERAVETDRSV